jgi:uncharacterized oxidoreductase
MKLTGHTVLITGGGSGIGGGLARTFHERGNKVIITGRREQTLKEFSAKFPGMEAFAMDVSKDSDIQRLFKVVSEKFPSLDILVNNAGLMKWWDFTKPETLGEGLFEEIDINLKGLIRMTAVFLPLLSKQKESTLINVSSGLAYMPLSRSPIYCATKAALHSLTMSLRHQLRGTPVRVIELAPPAVKTDLGKSPGVPEVKYPMLELDAFIALTMKALESGAAELPIGQSKMLRWGGRFLPSVFFNMLNPKTSPSTTS